MECEKFTACRLLHCAFSCSETSATAVQNSDALLVYRPKPGKTDTGGVPFVVKVKDLKAKTEKGKCVSSPYTFRSCRAAP